MNRKPIVLPALGQKSSISFVNEDGQTEKPGQREKRRATWSEKKSPRSCPNRCRHSDAAKRDTVP